MTRRGVRNISLDPVEGGYPITAPVAKWSYASDIAAVMERIVDEVLTEPFWVRGII